MTKGSKSATKAKSAAAASKKTPKKPSKAAQREVWWKLQYRPANIDGRSGVYVSGLSSPSALSLLCSFSKVATTALQIFEKKKMLRAILPNGRELPTPWSNSAPASMICDSLATELGLEKISLRRSRTPIGADIVVGGAIGQAREQLYFVRELTIHFGMTNLSSGEFYK